MREIRLLGSISGMWKRSYGSSIETPPDERGGHSCDEPTATAPHLDFTLKSRGPRRASRTVGVSGITNRPGSPGSFRADTEKAMHLTLIRHAQSVSNAGGLTQAHLAIPLTAPGQQPSPGALGARRWRCRGSCARSRRRRPTVSGSISIPKLIPTSMSSRSLNPALKASMAIKTRESCNMIVKGLLSP